MFLLVKSNEHILKAGKMGGELDMTEVIDEVLRPSTSIFIIFYSMLAIMSAKSSHSILTYFIILMRKIFLTFTQLPASFTRWP